MKGSPAEMGSAGYQLWTADEAAPWRANTTGGPRQWDGIRKSIEELGREYKEWRLRFVEEKKEDDNKKGSSSAAPPQSQKTSTEDLGQHSGVKQVEEWKRTRCWITDLRYANLAHARFEGAEVGGADFRYANLTGVSFQGADVSRANFQGAVGLTSRTFEGACAGPARKADQPEKDKLAQPVGVPDDMLPNGQPISRCPAIMPVASGEIASAPAIPGIYLWHNVLLATWLFVAGFVFWLVGIVAEKRLRVFVGGKFGSRFPERERYTTAQLQAFVTEYPSRARFYVFPVLFPLDLIVMTLLAGSVGAATFYWIWWPWGLNWAYLGLLPATCYFAADLVEDVALAGMIKTALGNNAAITDSRVGWLKGATKFKFISVWTMLAVLLASLLFYLWGTGCNWSFFEGICKTKGIPNPLELLPNDLSFLHRQIGR